MLGPCMEVMKRNVVAYKRQLVEIFGSEVDAHDETLQAAGADGND